MTKDLVKTPVRLADGWRWIIWHSGKHRPDQFPGDDRRLHSDMLLHEWLVPNNVNVQLILSCSQPHGQGRPLQAAAPGKVPDCFRGQIPASNVVTRHFTLAVGTSMADMNSLFTEQIPTKLFILVSNEAFVSNWQKNPFNFAHIELNSACLVVDGRPLLAQPWQPDFMQGLYAKTYHAPLKFRGMSLSYWSNGMSVE